MLIRDVGEADDDVYVIGLREAAVPDAWSLLLMECCDADDPQDVSLGMDTYCLVVDPGQATHYGGVRECDLGAESLRLVFSDEAAGVLRLPAVVTLALDLDDEQLGLLRRGLPRVLTSGRPGEVPRLSV